MDAERAWILRPIDILRNPRIVPKESQTFVQRFNTTTRLLIVICIILAVFKFRYWPAVLVIGLFLLMHSYAQQTEMCLMEVNSKKTPHNFSVESSTPVKVEMSRPVESYYTRQRIPAPQHHVSLRTASDVPTDVKRGEDITIAKVAQAPSHAGRGKIVMSTAPVQALKLKGKNPDARHLTAAAPYVERQDFMRAAFETLEDAEAAEQDTRNMEALAL